MKIYNSLTNKKEEFKPLYDNEIRMYVCGITAYDVCHLGHLRGAIIFDVVRNYFQYRGCKVKFVKNITDVDDKIIGKAREESKENPGQFKDLNQAVKSVAEKYTKKYYEDMKKFRIEDANEEPKATEHIQDMIDIIRRLIKKGHAYIIDSDVYFDVSTFPEYGKLSNQDLDKLKQGARIEAGEKKKNGLDFALWKAAKEEEPSWDSPWGKGRPGWHIECSAMSSKYLGETFDIHGGGVDLIFPHHENEIAQSEAATRKPFAKIWMHNGLLTINGEKMAKSLGNYVTIDDALKKYDAETIRLFMLTSHYRHPVDFNDEKMKETNAAKERFYVLFDKIDRNMKGERCKVESIENDSFKKKIDELKNKFIETMDDDFNTPAALGVLFDMASATNRVMGTCQKGAPRTLHAQDTSGVPLSGASPACLTYTKETIFELGKILGLFKEIKVVFNEKEMKQIADIASKYLESTIEILEDPKEAIEALINLRNSARTAKDFKKADSIRRYLSGVGIMLEDEKGKTYWRKV